MQRRRRVLLNSSDLVDCAFSSPLKGNWPCEPDVRLSWCIALAGSVGASLEYTMGKREMEEIMRLVEPMVSRLLGTENQKAGESKIITTWFVEQATRYQGSIKGKRGNTRNWMNKQIVDAFREMCNRLSDGERCMVVTEALKGWAPPPL